MKKTSYLLTLLLILFLLNHPAQVQGQGGMNHDTTHIAFNEGDITWGDAPPIFQKGAKMAVLEGDPSKEGEFTVRLSMPANYKIAPHWHPTTENVTVLEGTLYMGMGEKLDESKATSLSTGGFTSLPANTGHFAFSKEGAVIQVHAMGPFAITYYNKTDDPRTK